MAASSTATAPVAPRVSIVLPAYNAQQHLAAAVQSMLDQTFREFELIVINDGSTDETLAILKDFQSRDSRVRIISRPNTGLVIALNEGIAAARAPLIARMDADDISLPQRLQKQIDFLDTHPDVVVLGTLIRAIDPHGLPLWDESDTPLTHDSIDRELLKGRGGVLRHPTVVLRRDAVLRAGGYRNQYNHAEDLDLFLRLAEIGQVANLPEMLLLYRQHFNSINRTKFALQAERVTQCAHEAARRRNAPLPADWKYSPAPPHAPEIQVREWGWLALKHNRADIARKHAWSLLGMQPMNLDSWRLLACALRGH